MSLDLIELVLFISFYPASVPLTFDDPNWAYQGPIWLPYRSYMGPIWTCWLAEYIIPLAKYKN